MSTSIIVSKHRWNQELAKRLALKTGHEFILIQKEEDLSDENIRKINPKFIFFAHWSSRIPSAIWGCFESIIFHMTDVPYGRGGSPLQNLIMRGHETTMLSALRCVEALDAGPVYLKQPLSLSGTAEEIFYRADKVIEHMIVKILQDNPVPIEQTGEPVVFKRRKPEESNLEASESLENVFDMIRMLDAEGYPKAFLQTQNLKFEFRKVNKVDGCLEAAVTIRDLSKKDEL